MITRRVRSETPIVLTLNYPEIFKPVICRVYQGLQVEGLENFKGLLLGRYEELKRESERVSESSQLKTPYL